MEIMNLNRCKCYCSGNQNFPDAQVPTFAKLFFFFFNPSLPTASSGKELGPGVVCVCVGRDGENAIFLEIRLNYFKCQKDMDSNCGIFFFFFFARRGWGCVGVGGWRPLKGKDLAWEPLCLPGDSGSY